MSNYKDYDIGVTFQMFGTDHIKANSLAEARRIALGNRPLPADRNYVSDSLEADDLSNLLLNNGWVQDEVDALTARTKDDLIREWERRKAEYKPVICTKISTDRIAAFLWEVYEVRVGEDGKEPQPVDKLVVDETVAITQSMIDKAEEYLKKKGIEEPCTILQELGLLLMGEDLYPGT